MERARDTVDGTQLAVRKADTARMTDRCTAATSNRRAYSTEDAECRPTEEQAETQKVNREQESERDAEIRRNQYFERNTDEGGRSARAASDASQYSPMLHEDLNLKSSQRTARTDVPLQDDPYGNAIIGAVGGGIVGGVRAAAAEALIPSAGVTPVAQQVAVQVGKGVATSVAKQAAVSTMRAPPPDLPVSSGESGSGSSSVPAGRTGPTGTSEIVPEPNQSVAPRYTPLVIQG